MKTRPAIPHREYIRLLMLAGVPINGTIDDMMGVIDILYNYEFNIHPIEYYEEIEDEIKNNRSESKMMNDNRPIYEHNCIMRAQKSKKPIFVNPNVTPTLYMAETAIDLMHVAHGISRRVNKVTRGILMIMNNQTYRQYMEIMLTKGVPLYSISGYLNNKQAPVFKVTEEQVRFYKRYIWSWTPMSEFEGTPLRNLYSYIHLNQNSHYYRTHRALLAIEDFDEVLIFMNAYDEDERKNINKKLFGLSATRILKGLRDGTSVRDYYVKTYSHADSSIAEEKRAEGAEALREKIDNLFASVTDVAKKRKTLDDVIAEETAYVDKGPMDPANIKRIQAQRNVERNKKN